MGIPEVSRRVVGISFGYVELCALATPDPLLKCFREITGHPSGEVKVE
jgi:hypothetical protein